MSSYEQYVQPYLPSEGRFIQVVIGRNFKNSGSEYKDNSGANGGNSGGNTSGMWQNGQLTPFLESLIDRLHNANKVSWLDSTVKYACYGDFIGVCDDDGKDEKHKAYWSFLGISEGLMGQKQVILRYQQKYGTSL
jgi:hypothetical protein